MKKTLKTRKGISIAMAVILLLNLLTGIPVFTAFAASPELELDWSLSATNVKPGDEVEVTVSLKHYNEVSIQDIMGMQVDVQLDTSKVSYVESTAKVLATSNPGDMIGASYNEGNQKVIFLFASMNMAELPFNRSNVALFKFAIQVSDTLSTDTVTQLLCTQFAVRTDSGDKKITVGNNPSIHIFVDQPAILLNGAAPTGVPYTNNVTVTFDKGTATIQKDGGAATAISSGYVANEDGYYEVTVIDAAGNTRRETFSIQLSVSSISMKTNPTRMQYIVDTVFDPAGGVVEITYSNGSKGEIALDAAMCDVTDVGAVVGSKKVTVTYDGKTTALYITVVEKSVTSISMKSNPTKTTYLEGQDLDLAGGKITVAYDNNTLEDIDITSGMVGGYQKNQIGIQTLIVTYQGKTTTFAVTVNAKTLTEIVVTTPPDKTNYIEGNTFDKTGMVVTAYYDNDTSAVITDYTVPSAPLTLGATQVTVTYLGKSAVAPITVAAKTLQSIAVTTQPTKTAYKIGNLFSAAGGVITLTYDNGSIDTVNITNAMCSGMDMDSVGVQTVTVTYGGKTTAFTITVQDKELVSISVKIQPSQKTFIEGTAFIVDGVITLHYDNDTTGDKNITTGMCSGYDMSKIGTQTVTITESGKTVSYQITVKAKSLVSIAVTTPPTKTVYIEGNVFEKAGMVVTATYDNGTSGVVTDYTVSPNIVTLGTTQITVIHQGKTATTPIVVNPKTLTGISVTTPPVKVSYIEGNTFDKTGMVVTASYDNGTSEPVTDYAVDKTVLALGDTQISVSYLGKTAMTPITVRAKALGSISIKTQPSQKTFLEGAVFTVDGVITLHYDNGTTEDKNITTGMCSGYDMSKIGTQIVTITESGKTVSYQIIVKAKSVVSIVVTTPPTKTVYVEGNTVDKAGMIVTATYDNGTSGEVTDYTVSPSVLTLGTTQVTVTYQGKTAVFDVTVNAKTLTAITLNTSAAKTTYFVGTDLDITGLFLIATYDNGTTAEFAVTSDQISGYDKSVVGEQTVTVTYHGQTATYQVKVISREFVDQLVEEIEALEMDQLTVADKDKVLALKNKYDAMSDFEKSAITNKDKLEQAISTINALLYPAVEQSFLNGEVIIKAAAGVVPHDATLKVAKKTPSAAVLAKVKGVYGENSLFIGYYDITLEDANGNKIQPNGKLSVTIKLDAGNANGKDLVLLYAAADGTITAVDAKFSNGLATFETDHLSEYGIVKKIAAADGKPPIPPTGEHRMLGLWMTLMLASAMALVLLARGRKALSH